jgi:hypothetical protein
MSIHCFPSASQKWIPSARTIDMGLITFCADHDQIVCFEVRSTSSCPFGGGPAGGSVDVARRNPPPCPHPDPSHIDSGSFLLIPLRIGAVVRHRGVPGGSGPAVEKRRMPRSAIRECSEGGADR